MVYSGGVGASLMRTEVFREISLAGGIDRRSQYSMNVIVIGLGVGFILSSRSPMYLDAILFEVFS